MAATFSLKEGFSPMLKYYIKTTEALKQLRADTKGVVSFEYVMVAFAIVSAVALAFGTGAGGAIKDALTTSINLIIGKLPA
jgi:Flp pilus assembly pilin Flp